MEILQAIQMAGLTDNQVMKGPCMWVEYVCQCAVHLNAHLKSSIGVVALQSGLQDVNYFCTENVYVENTMVFTQYISTNAVFMHRTDSILHALLHGQYV